MEVPSFMATCGTAPASSTTSGWAARCSNPKPHRTPKVQITPSLFLSSPRAPLCLSLPPLCLSWQRAAGGLTHHNSQSPPVCRWGRASRPPSGSPRRLCSQTWCCPRCHLQSSPGHGAPCCPGCPAPAAWLSGGGCLKGNPLCPAGWYRQPRRGEVHLERTQSLEGEQKGVREN